MIVVPLIKDGRLVATLATNQYTPRNWTADEITVVQETAERTWAAVERAYAEAALRQSEEKYRSLFELIDEGFNLLEMISDESGHSSDFRILETNPAWEQQTGLTDAVGKTLLEITPNFEQQWLDFYGDVAISGRGRRIEYYTASVDRWYTVYASRIGGEGSRQVAVVFNDISERKQRERQQEYLLKLADALRPLSNAVEIQNTATRILGEHLQTSRVFYANIEDDKAHWLITDNYVREGVEKLTGRGRVDDFGWATAELLAGKIMFISDVKRDENLVESVRESFYAQDVMAVLAIPLVKKGQWVSTLGLHHHAPRQWSEEDIKLAQETAERTWAAVERARAEIDLRESEEKYRSLFESINDGFALLELLYDADDRPIDCRFLEVSPSFEAQTTLPQAQGKTLRELIPSVEPDWFEHYHQALVTNAPVHFEMYQSYIKIWLEVDVLPYGNPQNRQVVIVFQNINDRKQAQANQIQLIREQAAREQERQRAETLAELDRAKTLFFSNVSHEFRTPLTLILSPVQDALSDAANPLPGVQRERLQLVHRNTLRLLKLVNTLLDFSRIEAGRMEAVYEPTDLAMSTTELASVFRSAIEQAGLRLVVDCPPLAESVYVDRQMWEKIVLNLLSNAFKFTFEGEIAVRLHLADDHHVTLQVQDTGTGIEPEQLPHILKRFYQVRAAKARTHEGSGIGLALVHELIKLHGGTMDVTSTPGVGSCFTVTNPLGTAHLPNDRIHRVVCDHTTATQTLRSTALGVVPYVQEAERWLPQEGARDWGLGAREDTSSLQPLAPNPSSSLQPLAPSPSAHILIVDDNADMRDYLTRILSEHHEVIAFADGAAALAAVNERVPDLILSDVMMPELDGFGLLKALRADARTQEIPVILLSARAGEESVIEGLLAGADDYLIKPFSAQELVTRVNAYLQLAHLRSQALQQERTINRRKDEVLSMVSHELNTPLVAILGWARLLQSNSPSPAMLSKALETIERNATLQAKVVEDLLDISRITVGKISLNLEPVHLQAIIENAIATVQQSLQTKDIRLDCHLDSAPVVLQGDRERLQQIILNLLTNAVKFTPNGGKIEINLQTDDDHAQITVADTGCGINDDFLPHIFDTFSQAPNTKKGLGLGLAIARSLVQLHGGTIAAHSPGIGQGTTFTVKLPITSP